MADLSVLEPLAGAGLAISLAYLALERFRYRRDVEAAAQKLSGKYDENTALSKDETMEHLQELRWLCRKKCNGHTPAGVFANVYRVMFRSHGDVFLISALAALAAIVLILGVSGDADITSKFSSPLYIKLGFWVCVVALILPGGGVLLGRKCRAWAIARAKECDRQVTHALTLSAQEAAVPTPQSTVGPQQPAENNPARTRKGRGA